MRLWMTALLVLVPMTAAQTLYLWDDWSDGDADGWIEDSTGATYEVTDSLRYSFSYQGGGDVYALSYWGTTMPAPDYELLTHFVGYGPTEFIGIDARLDPTAMTAYVAYANYQDDLLTIVKYAPGYNVLAATPFNLQYDVSYSMKFSVNGHTLSAKIWEMGSAEPASWMVTVTDDELSDALYAGLEAYRAPIGSFHAEFYSILVMDWIPDALEQSTWGAIKTIF